MGGTRPFFRPDEEFDLKSSKIRTPKGAEKADGENARKPGYIRRAILSYIGKAGIAHSDLYEFTLAEIMHMIFSREEELQISWAMSAQDPNLLPESIKSAGEAAKKKQKRAEFEAYMKEKFKK